MFLSFLFSLSSFWLADEIRLKIPSSVGTCDRCVLQWAWTTANSQGTYPEAFWNCADIKIETSSFSGATGCDAGDQGAGSGSGGSSSTKAKCTTITATSTPTLSAICTGGSLTGALKASASTIECVGTSCTTSDKIACCASSVAAAKCNTLTSSSSPTLAATCNGATYTGALKPSASSIECADSTCTTSDASTCCTHANAGSAGSKTGFCATQWSEYSGGKHAACIACASASDCPSGRACWAQTFCTESKKCGDTTDTECLDSGAAKCDSFTCTDGKTNNGAGTSCSGDASSCNEGTCCTAAGTATPGDPTTAGPTTEFICGTDEENRVCQTFTDR